jgi:hypothetical protein
MATGTSPENRQRKVLRLMFVIDRVRGGPVNWSDIGWDELVPRQPI